MAVKGKIFAEKNNFLYNVEQYDFIYLLADDFYADEEGFMYVDLDTLFYTSFKELVRMYGKSLPSIIPVTVLGDTLTQDSFMFHFNWATRPFLLETISKFEAREIKSEIEQVVINSEINIVFTKSIGFDFLQEEDNPISKKDLKIKTKERYEFFLKKELESSKNKMIKNQQFLEAGKIDKKIQRKSKKLAELRKLKKVKTK